MSESAAMRSRREAGLRQDSDFRNLQTNQDAQLEELAARLRQELETSQRLQQVSTRLVQVADYGQLLSEILDAVVDISHAKMGTIQLAQDGTLSVAAQRGFESASPDFFRMIEDPDGAGGEVLRRGERVIVEDISGSAMYGPRMREAMLAAGICSMQSTPLISHSGRVLGMFSTYDSAPKRPAEAELRALDVLARLASDLIDRKQTEEALRKSEQLLRVVTEATPVLVWMAGLDKLCFYFNKSWLDYVGRTLEQERGNGWAENVHPEDFERCLEIYTRSFDAHQPFQMEYRLRHHSGQYRWILDCGVPRYAPDGTFEGYVGGCLDIHDTKESAEVRHRLAAIVESSNDAIVSKDLNSIVTSWNKRAEKMFGYSAAEMIGQSILKIIPPEMHQDEDMILANIRSGRKIDHFETVRLTKSGERIEVSLSISPVRDEQGKIIGAAKIARDITESKKLERTLHITEKIAAAGRLAATVAHEINNPLESVTNFVYLAKTSPELPASLRRYLDSADQELLRVAHIARQTLGFYRGNARPGMIEVTRLVDDVVTIYQRKLDNKNISLTRRIDSDLRIRAVEGEVKQVLSNLLANAIDACDYDSQIAISARGVRARDGRPGVRIVVADRGEGIAPHHKAKLFAPFFTTKKDVGTGLGLWITKELVEKAGGSIRLHSCVGERSGTAVGISFWLENQLPAEKVI